MMNVLNNETNPYISKLPFRYRLYGPFHHLLTKLGRIKISNVHPFMVLRNRISRLLYCTILNNTSLFTVDTKDGFLICVPLNDQAAVSVLFERSYSPEETRVLAALSTLATSFVDVGANLGYMSLLVGSVTQHLPTFKVIAIEPNKKLCSLMESSVDVNNFSQFRVLAAGAGDTVGQMYLEFDARLSSNACTVGWSSDADFVDMIKVDNVIEWGKSYSESMLIKIDVEGNEVNVLRGCEMAMDHAAMFMCEIMRENLQDVNGILTHHNYAFLTPHGRPIHHGEVRKSKSNLLLVPEIAVPAVARCLESLREN